MPPMANIRVGVIDKEEKSNGERSVYGRDLDGIFPKQDRSRRKFSRAPPRCGEDRLGKSIPVGLLSCVLYGGGLPERAMRLERRVRPCY